MFIFASNRKKSLFLFSFFLFFVFLFSFIFKSPVYAADPTPQWTSAGAAVTNTNGTVNYVFPPLTIADGSGNTFVAWLDKRNSTNNDIYIQKFDSNGVAQWTANGVRLTSISSYIYAPNMMILDGAGGVIIEWGVQQTGYDQIFVQRVDGSGSSQWTANGVEVDGGLPAKPYYGGSEYQNITNNLISDGSNGAIVIWEDKRNSPSTPIEQAFAQRVDSTGAFQWSANGVLFSGSTYGAFTLSGATDGSGGAFAAWTTDSHFGNILRKIVVQKIDNSGAIQFGTDGISLTAFDNTDKDQVRATSDGTGGVYVTWDGQPSSNALFQVGVAHVDNSGSNIFTPFLMSENAALVSGSCDADGDFYIGALPITDGFGNLIMPSMEDCNYNIYLQKVSASGSEQWGTGGVLIPTVGYYEDYNITRGSGGSTYVVWTDYISSHTLIHGQLLDSSGVKQWTTPGFNVSNNSDNDGLANLVYQPGGKLVVAWQDTTTKNYLIQELLNSYPPVTHLEILPSTTNVNQGTALDATVRAEDAGNNIIPTYTGTIHFTSNDGTATLPGDYTFLSGDGGSHIFTGGVTFNTGGDFTITATDSGNSINGTSASIHVNTPAPTTATLWGNGNWSDPTYWDLNYVPQPGDDVIIKYPNIDNYSAETSNNDLGNGITYHSITIDATQIGSTLTGNSVILTNGLFTTKPGSFGQAAFNLPITLNGVQPLNFTSSYTRLNSSLKIGSNNITVNGNGNRTYFNGAIIGTGNLTLNNGRYIFAGNSPSFTGNINANAATSNVYIEVNGSLPNTPLTFNTNRYVVLSGTGTLGSFTPISDNYTIEPGSIYGTYIGTLSFNGNFVIPAGSPGNSELAIEMNGTTPGTQYSQLSVNGTVDLSGDIYIDPYLDYDPIVGSTYTIINNTGSNPIIGQIEDPINDVKIAEGGTFTDFYDENYSLTYQGGDGNDLVITALGYTTVTTVNASSPTTALGNNVTFTAHVVGYGASVNGDTVTFLDGVNVLGTGTVNGSGNATFSTSSLSLGVHNITARHEASTVNAVSTSSPYTETIFVPVSGHQIINLPSNLDTLDVNGNSVKQGSPYSLNDPNDPITLKTTAGLRVVDTIVNMTADRDWGTITADSDSPTGKSFVHNVASAPGAASTYDLYVPQLGSNTGVLICPYATSLATVTANCTWGYSVSSNNANVTLVNVNSQNYLVIHGVSGNAGGLSISGSIPDSGLNTILGQWDVPTDTFTNGVSVFNSGSPNTSSGDLRTMSDGSGGEYVVWADNRSSPSTLNYIPYAQRVDVNGNSLWTTNGVALCTGCLTQDAQYTTITSDGSGGIVATWYDKRNGTSNIDIYAQRIDSNGNILWGSGGLLVRHAANNAFRSIAVADGSGGTYIIWLDERIGVGGDQVYGQYLNSAGVAQWSANGILLSGTNAVPFRGFIAAPDGAGNVLVAWKNPDPPYQYALQKFNSSGGAVWGSLASISSLPAEWSQMIPDGSGGAFLEWDMMIGSIGKVYAQHMDVTGAPTWGSDGVLVSTNTSDNAEPSNTYYYSGDDRNLVMDGTGGLYLSWFYYNTGGSYVQRLDNTGTKQWGVNGINLKSANGLLANLQTITIVSDGSGGIYVAFMDSSDFGFYGIYLQRFNQAGTAFYNPGCSGDANGYFAMRTYGEPIYLNTGSSPSDIFLTTRSNDLVNGNWHLYTQKFNESTHGYQIKGLPSDLDAIDINGNSVKKGTAYGLSCVSESIKLKKISTNTPIADIASVNFRYQPIWSSVSSDNDLAQKKVFFGDLNNFVNQGINCYYSCSPSSYNVYVPRVSNDSNAHLCPTATNLGTITNSCTSGSDVFNASSTTVNSQSYWYMPSVVGAMSENISSTATILRVVPGTLNANVGSSISVTVTAKDTTGYTATNYAGTVHFTSTAGVNGSMPSDYTFVSSDNGSHTFNNVVFNAGGNFTITSTDTITSSITGISDSIQVNAALQNSSTNLQSNLNPSNSGNNVTFTATVTGGSGTATGNVTFKDGATTIGSNNLNGSGVATFSTAALSVGSHNITAVYNGDSTYNPNTSNTVAQVVNSILASSSTNLQSSLNPSVVGQNVTLTVTVTGGSGTPTGQITFEDGVTVLGIMTLNGSGVTTYNTSSLSIGSHNIRALYGADSTYGTSTSNTVVQVVNPLTTTATNLQSSLNPSNSGDSVTFTATVTGGLTPSGQVTFYDGVTNLGQRTLDAGGVATLITSSLSVGSHNITTNYEGDSTHNISSSNTVTQIVNTPTNPPPPSPQPQPQPETPNNSTIELTSMTLASSKNPSKVGDNVTFTVNLVGDGTTPTGTVTFYNGTISMGVSPISTTGTSTYSTSTLGAGSYNITAKYSGDSTYAAKTSSILVQVVNANQPAPQPTPISSPTGSNSGSNGTTVPVNETTNGNNGSTDNIIVIIGDGITNVGNGLREGLAQGANSITDLISQLTGQSRQEVIDSVNGEKSLTPYIPATIGITASSVAAASAVIASESGSAGVGILGIFTGIFIPRKKKYYGIIYDEITSKGIAFASISLRDEMGMIIGQTISDLDGKYKLSTTGNNLMLEVKVEGYKVESRKVENDMVDEGNIIAAVAMVKLNARSSLKTVLYNLGSKLSIYISKITLVLTVIGLGINLYAVIESDNLYNKILLGIYGAVTALMIYKSIVERFKSKGGVYDELGMPIVGASVRIYDINGSQLEVEISNSKGEVRFKIGEGSYKMSINKKGYVNEGKEGLVPVEILKGGRLSRNIVLKSPYAPLEGGIANSGLPTANSGVLDNPFSTKAVS